MKNIIAIVLISLFSLISCEDKKDRVELNEFYQFGHVLIGKNKDVDTEVRYREKIVDVNLITDTFISLELENGHKVILRDHDYKKVKNIFEVGDILSYNLSNSGHMIKVVKNGK